MKTHKFRVIYERDNINTRIAWVRPYASSGISGIWQYPYVASLAKDIKGFRVFRGTFYDNFIVTPLEIDAGTIQQTERKQVILQNTLTYDLARDITVQSIDKVRLTTEYVDLVPPVTLRPYRPLVTDVVLPLEGVPTVNGAFIFHSDIGDAILKIKVSRLLLIPLFPEEYKETLKIDARKEETLNGAIIEISPSSSADYKVTIRGRLFPSDKYIARVLTDAVQNIPLGVIVKPEPVPWVRIEGSPSILWSSKCLDAFFIGRITKLLIAFDGNKFYSASIIDCQEVNDSSAPARYKWLLSSTLPVAPLGVWIGVRVWVEDVRQTGDSIEISGFTPLAVS